MLIWTLSQTKTPPAEVSMCTVSSAVGRTEIPHSGPSSPEPHHSSDLQSRKMCKTNDIPVIHLLGSFYSWLIWKRSCGRGNKLFSNFRRAPKQEQASEWPWWTKGKSTKVFLGERLVSQLHPGSAGGLFSLEVSLYTAAKHFLMEDY